MTATWLLFPFLPAAGVEVRNDIEFSNVAGEVLRMDAHIPQGPGPFAAVILVHGGGWSGGSKQAAFIKPLFPVLDGSGLAWFSIDYRLSPKYQHPAAAEDVGQERPDVGQTLRTTEGDDEDGVERHALSHPNRTHAGVIQDGDRHVVGSGAG